MDVPAEVREFLAAAIKEDLGGGDITSRLTIADEHASSAVIRAKEPFVVAGLPFAREVFLLLDERVSFEALKEDGSPVSAGEHIARLQGKTRSLLAGERVALNVLQRLSGIATLTSRFVREVEGLGTKILDTRKTTPCMRYLEKYAVRAGGGENHRMGLYDAVLIKDNHIKAAGGVKKAVRLAKTAVPPRTVEVEAETLEDVREALEAGADIIMLDNMPLGTVKEAVRAAKGRALLEVSGNVTLQNVRELAETGVDMISVGAITHSAPAADISMRVTDPSS
jgi:nicotinate-nucleotide pyrophosphorylase (carboxylating)